MDNDIVVANGNLKPIWVEVKSLKSPMVTLGWKPWQFTQSSDSSNGREWMLDRIAAKDNRQEEKQQLASRFEWWLHAFKTKPSAKSKQPGTQSYTQQEWKELRKMLTPKFKDNEHELLGSLGYSSAHSPKLEEFNVAVRAGCYIKSFSPFTYLFKDTKTREVVFEGISNELLELFFSDDAEPYQDVEVNFEC